MTRNQKSVINKIPLYRPDLTKDDEHALLLQLAKKPFRDDGQLVRWEGAWGDLWERSAVAFADHLEPVKQLKKIMGWHSGDVVGADGLLDPVWQEALAGAWLHLGLRDVDGVTGQAVGGCEMPAEGGTLRAMMVQHAFGLPTPLPEGSVWVLEEVSSVVRPVAGCGGGAVQLVNLEGPRMVSTGTGCVLLSQDHRLIAELAKLRQNPPGGAVCALGLSQLASLEDRLARRQELAERYLGMRLEGLAAGPAKHGFQRGWEVFFLTMTHAISKTDLETFLRRAAIGCGSPVWFRPSGDHLPGMRQFLERSLAVPMYAALTDAECKRIINRVERWIGRMAIKYEQNQ